MRLVDIVLGNLRRRKGRMMLIVTGLAIGVGTIVALRSLTTTIEQEIGAQLDQYGANIVIVPRSSSQNVSYGGTVVSAAPFDIHPLRTEDIGRIRSIPYANRLSVIAPKLLGGIGGEGEGFYFSGVDFSQELRMKKWWQVSGRVPEEADEVLLGYDAARRLGVIEVPISSASAHSHEVAKEPQLNLRRSDVTVAGRSFRVAGVLHETGGQDDGFIYGQLRTAQKLLGRPEELSLIEVSALCNGCPIEDIVSQISGALPGAKVSAVQQAVLARVQAVQRLSRFTTAISVVMLFIGSLMIFIAMMASVVERTQEIGVLRALGFRRSHIVKIFVIESALVSLFGGGIGWVIGTLLGVLSAPYFTETGVGVSPSFSLAMGALTAAVLIGVTSTLYPAVKASKLDPTESLRYF